MSIQTTEADPLYTRPGAERPSYATGMLLDAQDFSDEQTYHRGRLARALAHLAGGGTLAGLAVRHHPGDADGPEEIRVEPGLAIDRLGRLIEVPRHACLRLQRWFDNGGAALQQASYPDLGRFVSARLAGGSTALPARAVVLDVFVRFAACAVGLTPRFAGGPFDALNAVGTARLRDAYELVPVARVDLSDLRDGLPAASTIDAVLADDPAGRASRRDALQDAVLGGWGGSGAALGPAAEHPAGLDTSAVFLARVLIPVEDTAGPPQRTADPPIVDNFARRFLPPVPLLAQCAGL